MQEQVAERVAGRSVLCAVSGGVDSVVLLYLLMQCGVRVEAMHVEHGIRGETSQRDCAFVCDLCASWHIPLHVVHLDVPAQAAMEKRGLEETARHLRYAALEKVRAEQALDLIATAHHLNDQAETVLMHLVRGTSPKGLEGMAQEKGRLIRPLLSFSRTCIEEYARAHQLAFVQDETNADIAYMRNYLRHEILPRLEKLNPRAVEALGRLADISRSQNAYIEMQAQSALREYAHGVHLSDVRSLHLGLRGTVLRQYLEQQGMEQIRSADIAALEHLLDQPTGKRVSLGKDLYERDTSGLRRVIMEADCVSFPLHLGWNDTPLGSFLLEYVPVPENLNLGRNAQALDAALAGERLCVRTRRSGDRVHLLGSAGSRLLSDVMTDKKVPRAVRGQVPLIERDGEIIWIAGIAPCAPCAIRSGCERALIIKYNCVKE